MLSKVKNFFKYTSLAYGYLILFILSQSLALMVVFSYFVMNNVDFQDRFIALMGPIYDNPNFNYFEAYDDILLCYMELMDGLLVPTLFISNLVIVAILGIKIFLNRKKETVIKKISLGEGLQYVFLGILLNFVISAIISFLPASLIESHSGATESLLNGNVGILLLTSGILAPIAEELICRYGMQKNLSKINIIFGIVYQALIFGFLHGNIVQSTYACVLGLIFGYIVYKKGNLLYSIILHISINTSSVLIASFSKNELIGMIYLLIICGIIILLNRIRTNLSK